mgnify:CR=1 FL=1
MRNVLLSDSDSIMVMDRQLMLIATSALLVFIKNGLLQQMPYSPAQYENPWDFYRDCCRFADLIEKVTTFIDIKHIELFPDIVQVINLFTSQLLAIRNYVHHSSLEPEVEDFQLFIPNFRTDLSEMIDNLYTTLCDLHACRTCNP